MEKSSSSSVCLLRAWMQSRACPFVFLDLNLAFMEALVKEDHPAFRYPDILRRTSAPKSRSSPWASAGRPRSFHLKRRLFFFSLYPRHPFIYFLVPSFSVGNSVFVLISYSVCIACGQPGRQRSLGRRKGGHATHQPTSLPPHPLFIHSYYCRQCLGYGPTTS